MKRFPFCLLSMALSSAAQLLQVLGGLNEWQFDSFKLDEVSNGRPLSCLAFYLLKSSSLISSFRLKEARLARFLIAIEDGYPDNPYHSRIHAADVLRTFHAVLHQGGVLEAVLGGSSSSDRALSKGRREDSGPIGRMRSQNDKAMDTAASTTSRHKEGSGAIDMIDTAAISAFERRGTSGLNYDNPAGGEAKVSEVQSSSWETCGRHCS